MQTYVLYDTALGAYPGCTEQMDQAAVDARNQLFRNRRLPYRWVAASCDLCDSRRNVEMIDGQVLCSNCR